MMDNNKLEYANELKKKINIKNNKLMAIEAIRARSIDEKEHCKISVYNDYIHLDQEIFDIALTLQEKRENKLCLELELTFERL